MDFGVVILLLAFLVMIVFHPATQMFIGSMKSKIRKNKSEESHKCYHTIGDCRECMSAPKCPMKHENVVIPKREEYD